MGTLAVLAIVGGAIQIPGVDEGVTKFLAPTFADSRLAQLHVGTGASWVGLIIGAVIAVAGIGIAYRIWVLGPGIAARLRERFVPVYEFLWHKWYFDELIDYAVVRPVLWTGGFVATVLERTAISGGVTGGTTGIVRAGSAAVRRTQTGFLRYYAALMVIGVFAVSLYFIVSS
jgi:NADH-quinone oxidoreductase subunit L